MIDSMRKKRDREASNEPELPLSEPSEERSVREVEKGNTAASRYGRRDNPAVFEFEEAASKAVPELDLDADANPLRSSRNRRPRPAIPKGRPPALRQSGYLTRQRPHPGAGRLEEALDSYRRLVAMDPAHIRARNNLGVLLDQMGSHDVALEHFQAAVEIDPENAEVLTNFGASLAAQGRYDEAESQLRKAARLDPAGIDVRANLGILYFRRGLYAQSDHELRWVCDRDPDHILAHFYRGEALNRLGRVDDALEMLERASHLQPDRARVYYLLGILYDKKNLKHEAGLMYRKARELTDR